MYLEHPETVHIRLVGVGLEGDLWNRSSPRTTFVTWISLFDFVRSILSPLPFSLCSEHHHAHFTDEVEIHKNINKLSDPNQPRSMYKNRGLILFSC